MVAGIPKLTYIVDTERGRIDYNPAPGPQTIQIAIEKDVYDLDTIGRQEVYTARAWTEAERVSIRFTFGPDGCKTPLWQETWLMRHLVSWIDKQIAAGYILHHTTLLAYDYFKQRLESLEDSHGK